MPAIATAATQTKIPALLRNEAEAHDLPRPHILPMLGNQYELAESYTYRWTHEDERGQTTDYRIIVPKGFTFDMASVPRVVWPLIGPFDLGPAAVVHDWMYRKKGHMDEGSFAKRGDSGSWISLTNPEFAWSRKDSDRLFGRIMRESNVSVWRRRAAYLAVRVFGGKAWRD